MLLLAAVNETDAELLTAMRSGDQSAAATFVRRHSGWAIQYARKLGAGDDSEDVAQVVLTGLIHRPPAALRTETAIPYLKTCIRREAARARRRSVATERTPGVGQRDPGTSPSAAAARAEDFQALGAALEQLATRRRRLVILRHWRGLSSFDIARITGQSPATVRSELSRAMARLRTIFFSSH